MAIRNKIIDGLELIKLNSKEDVFEKEDLFNKCIMCREEMKEETKEHIFPRWLQKKYSLETQRMTLPNGTTMKYNQILVPCCKTCNGGIMSQWEMKIQNAVDAGYEEFIKIDSNVIAWWVYKIYYSKLVKESQLKKDIRDPFSVKMIEEELLQKYNNIYMVMSNLIKGFSYEGFVPYEIYIFKTDDEIPFDYCDDVITHTVYMKLGDILLVCSLDCYNIYTIQYKRELEILKKNESVHPLQAFELFAKMVYFRHHYGFNTVENYVIDSNGCRMKTEVTDLTQIKEFDLKEEHELLTNIFKLRGFDVSEIKYEEGKVISLIS